MSLYAMLKTAIQPINESSLKSTIDPDFKPNGKLKLASFKRVDVDKAFINKNKGDVKLLSHIKPTSKDYTSYAWLDGDNIVAVASVDYDNFSGYKWITAIEVSPNYRGNGLGTQLLDYAVSKMGGEALTVATDNDVAKVMYEKHGFKISPDSLAEVKAGKREVYFMYRNFTSYIKNETATKSIYGLYGILNEAKGDTSKKKEEDEPEEDDEPKKKGKEDPEDSDEEAGTKFSFADDDDDKDPAASGDDEGAGIEDDGGKAADDGGADPSADEGNPDNGGTDPDGGKDGDEGAGTDFSFSDGDDDGGSGLGDDPAGDTGDGTDGGDDSGMGDDGGDGSDTGEGDDGGEPAEPENPADNIVQPKILNISTLDRALMKKKIYEQYNELLSLAYGMMNMITDNKILIDEEDRDEASSTLNGIIEAMDLYLKHKFYNNNYEINLRNYIVFSKKLDDLVVFIGSLTKHKNNDD